jgi:CrcB protein
VFKKASKDFPFSTLLINVLGSFVLGLTSNAYSMVFWMWGVQVGFLGAFTTFSTVQLEFLNMIKYKQTTNLKLYPLVYLISNYLLCIVFACIGTIL